MDKDTITKLLVGLLSMISPDLLKSSVDALLDVIENKVEKTKTSYDDLLVLPVIGVIRAAFDIKDNDNA